MAVLFCSWQVAYLASTLFLDHNSELIVLVVNTLQRDLADDNVLVGVQRPRACILGLEQGPG